MNTTTEVLPHVHLQFSLKHPGLDDCWREGFDCMQDDVDEEDNPYAAGSLEHEYWHQGWWAAFYGEEPLFSKSFGRETLSVRDLIETAITSLPPANEDDYRQGEGYGWAGRLIKVAGVIAVAVAAIEILEIAV